MRAEATPTASVTTQARRGRPRDPHRCERAAGYSFGRAHRVGQCTEPLYAQRGGDNFAGRHRPHRRLAGGICVGTQRRRRFYAVSSAVVGLLLSGPVLCSSRRPVTGPVCQNGIFGSISAFWINHVDFSIKFATIYTTVVYVADGGTGITVAFLVTNLVVWLPKRPGCVRPNYAGKPSTTRWSRASDESRRQKFPIRLFH